MRSRACRNVAALERSDNVADRDHAFAVLKRGYTSEEISGWRLAPAFLCGFRGGGCYR